ncbi:class A beta-lactamase-related serine hydrolase [Flavobacterium circumlabens]|uniref:Class A beta-lactamase-related serine hydrolase n=1 Tax=Flavobacterium circumlabens TaxID=2133765 RepID=A0A4Y7UIA6_9FLAO|nr:serine hydrolase domain-containing protein [Flavobacterium circumlabens]TCN60989.1 CubicO group peptidase (beta-lactamase class C family) [Flavobacterium circumlabens]TEB46106.1 class A beta-lactamase-related serine hydrolase [Flavobacterium circumlabens]
MKRIFAFALSLSFFTTFYGQKNSSFADSIRIKHKIPELAYAVVSSDSVLEIQALGYQRFNTSYKAKIDDRFRLGSLTKTVTSYIATLLVKEGKIKWDTKFFDLYPELKSKSNPAAYDFTLQDFLTFRANLDTWSYGNKTPTQKEIKGNNQQQRYQFIEWFFQQKPIVEKQEIYWSNPSYVAAGLMLEKATGKTYETLVQELGKLLNIAFDFGQPNLKDKNQPWGHDENLKPKKPALNYKLNWLSSAGNVNVSLPDYCKFAQLQLNGLLGKSKRLTAEEFNNMHFGFSEFSFGWESETKEKSTLKYSFHNGNPGTFLTKVYLCPAINKAFIIFANVQSEEADKGLMLLLGQLQKQYGG